jgi:hypothetical protein
MRVSGQLHALAPLLTRSMSQGRLGGHRRGSGRFGREKNILLLTGIEP